VTVAEGAHSHRLGFHMFYSVRNKKIKSWFGLTYLVMVIIMKKEEEKQVSL
jgi:hypothetical protein